MDGNKRKQPRLPFAVGVEIQVGEESISGSTRDISTTGLFIESEISPPLDAPRQFHIALSSGEMTHSINGQGNVRYIRDGEGLGLECIDLDPESLALLWRYIRDNTPAEHQDGQAAP